MQETLVQSLAWEYPTCCGTAKPMHPNYRACAPEPRDPQLLSPRTAPAEACAPWSPRSATGEATAMRSLHTTGEQPPLAPTGEKPGQQGIPMQPKINKSIVNIFPWIMLFMLYLQTHHQAQSHVVCSCCIQEVSFVIYIQSKMNQFLRKL